MEVHSQSTSTAEYPNVSFIGGSTITLPNHAYVDLNLVGEEGPRSVRCHTDLNTCCSEAEGIHRGDWIPPGSDTRLPFISDTSADIYQMQKEQRVILRRRSNTDLLSGIYRCDIPTNAVHDDDDTTVRKSVYVGLYATGGNNCCIGCHVTLYNYTCLLVSQAGLSERVLLARLACETASIFIEQPEFNNFRSIVYERHQRCLKQVCGMKNVERALR